MSNVDKYRDLSRYKDGSSVSKHDSFNPRNYKKPSSKFSNDQQINGASINNDNLSYKTAQYSRGSQGKYSHKHIAKKKRAKKKKNIIKGLVAVLILAVIGVAAYKFWPINVVVNNQELTLTYDKSLNEALVQSGIKVNPGNFVAVDLSTIKNGEGYEEYITLNNTEVNDKNIKLKDNDQIKYENGHDKMEDYDSIDSKIMAKSSIEGVGSIHKFEGNGEPGVWSQMTGKVSKIFTERQTKDPQDVTVKQYNVDPEQDKVIALTFDDGPSEEYTEQILSILKKYNAHATFFVIGENVDESWGQKLVKKEDSEGHQVCTHTYDHARGVGGTDITVMSAEKQIQEIVKGQESIAKALKKDASKVCRLPGGNMNAITARLIAPYVNAEIGWNVDTGDWKSPDVDKLIDNMESASSGNVVLCHDGGGDRGNTVKAIEKFLDDYTKKGYKFITIDELMQYKTAPQKASDKNTISTYSYKYGN